jgi:hypothetical protein
MYAEEVPIYTNQTTTERRLESVYRRGTSHIPIHQLHIEVKTVYTEEVPIYTYISRLITQRR